MQFPKVLIVLGLVPALLMLAAEANAQQIPESKATGWALARIGKYARSTGDPEQIKQMLLQFFRSVDLDGGGVTEGDFLLQGRLRAAKSRGDVISSMARLDLDGDGAVSRTEIEIKLRPQASKPMLADGVMFEPTPEQVRQRLEKLVGDMLRLDGDGDGIIVFGELLADAMKRYPLPTGPVPDSQRPVPSYLDEDGDGVVALEEFAAIVERAIEYLDHDGDGNLSPEERNSASAQAQEFSRNEAVEKREQRKAQLLAEQARKLVESCGLPKAPADIRVLLLVAYEGQALSTVGIGGDDEEVHVIDVRVEAGDNPLFVVATSGSSVIWRFSGALDRVVRLVADSFQRAKDGSPRTGVTGLPADRIHFPAARDCTPDYESMKKAGMNNPKTKVLAGLIGHDIDDIVFSYDAALVSLPGGAVDEKFEYPDRVELPKGTPGEPLWREMLRFNPGGLVRIEPGAVVSALPVKPFKVLPQQAGLAQLLDDGALKPQGKHNLIEVEELKKAYEQKDYVPQYTTTPAAFVIQRKITYPAGLYGAHKATFILPPGVPEPEGTAGHSEVIRKKVDTE